MLITKFSQVLINVIVTKHDVTIIKATFVSKKRFNCLPKFSVCHYTHTCNIRKILFYGTFPDRYTFIMLSFYSSFVDLRRIFNKFTF